MTKYNPETHHRRSIRLKHYDYSQAGAYFITVCTHSEESTVSILADGIHFRIKDAPDTFEEYYFT